ncbi:MAG TPA: ribonuclease J [Sphingomonas sp.]|jgi:ribonuclease J|nr:ribonuclease J [Sphingomonas sp.]
MTTPKNELIFLALGGSDEIGMNVNLYGCQGKWLMVDCGLTFANPAEYPGCELVLPDLKFIEDRADDLLGIVLTHGHEDHIGALPYLAQDLGVPLYANAFTATLIRGKFDREGVDDVEIHVIPEGGTIDLAPFKCTMVRLAHSIPDMDAVLIDTPHGRVFHTGDWKLDADPVLGEPANAAALTAMGDEGILALVCDSTNAFNDRESGTEGSVRDGLMEAVAAAKGRVVVTSFASNLARMRTLGQVAKANNRKLCIAGRSLDRMLTAAQQNGYLKDLPPLVDFETAAKMPPRDILVIATGGQGEPRAALGRIAFGDHPIKVDSGDTVIFSSKQIPGNETAIGRVQNALARTGVTMVTEKQAHVHVSGHPGRPELAAMYRWLRPEILVPVHGERRHMAEQARFGLAEGIPQAIVQSNGDVVRLAPNGPKIVGNEGTGRLILDGDVILPADGATINERRRIAAFGQISVAIALQGKRLIGDPVIKTQGVPVEEDREAFLEEAADDATKAVRDAKSLDKLPEAVRLAVRRCAVRWTGKKPVVDVLVIEA